MRDREVHLANLSNPLDELDRDLVEQGVLEGSVFHIGCLIGRLLAELRIYSKAYLAGCEDYPLASSYAKHKNNQENISETPFEVKDDSFDIVIVDPDYYPAHQKELLAEAARIAVKGVVYGLKHDELVTEMFPDYASVIVNDKYGYLDLNERSNTTKK